MGRKKIKFYGNVTAEVEKDELAFKEGKALVNSCASEIVFIERSPRLYRTKEIASLFGIRLRGGERGYVITIRFEELTQASLKQLYSNFTDFYLTVSRKIKEQ